ncbi:hypothetical protein HanXRQr2_Chr04g0172311 [Helianthus annuus]|uniref:Uncharacterized protein n=1 Tax=Helianthus annuus TaxID=4232 RepID=A0A251UZ50_HELAN|nr:hypothetical protein HanXRQr2_Chr04g0172311 [Helianthus annuus]KAJ0931786.1 hypothetical protein HanPSC8_Chr04g0165961 [Helianthus annuus]
MQNIPILSPFPMLFLLPRLHSSYLIHQHEPKRSLLLSLITIYGLHPPFLNTQALQSSIHSSILRCI